MYISCTYGVHITLVIELIVIVNWRDLIILNELRKIIR